jgi:dTDP-glucose 4,6-dehydratase
LRVAVLGSTSFAGSDFVDLLLEEGRFDVLGISRSAEKPAAFAPYAERPHDRFRFVRCDLNEDPDGLRASLDAFEPDYVVNYAAQGDDAASWAHPADFFRTNCVALARVIDHLKDRPGLRRFLQISSSGVYGNPRGRITEDAALAPESPYGVSKAAADLLLLAYHRHAGFPALMIRPPNLYGPGQQLFRIVPKAIVMVKRGETVELHGGGRAVRRYLHVRDNSRAVRLLMDRGETGQAYNVAPDESYRIRDVVALVCELLGADLTTAVREVEDRRAQSSAQDLDSIKIRALGWSPQIGLRSGIAGVIAWIEQNWPAFAHEQLGYSHQR